MRRKVEFWFFVFVCFTSLMYALSHGVLFIR
jgi:hypothetical protein